MPLIAQNEIEARVQNAIRDLCEAEEQEFKDGYTIMLRVETVELILKRAILLIDD